MSALAACLGAVPAAVRWLRPRSALDGMRVVVVRRADLDLEVVAAGRVESSESTQIRCTLERLNIPGQAGTGGLTVGGASTILSLIPDGSTVQKGDVLCELDATGYQELVRRQRILVKQAQAEYRQAALVLDVARIDLRSYTEGERRELDQQFRAQIALGRSDVARQSDRLAWIRRMRPKGYSSRAQEATEDVSLERMAATLDQTITAYRNYRQFTAPKDLLFLRSQVISARAKLEFQSIRLRREQDRLKHYESLVERCTVRAPHDGFVVYANRPGRALTVYPGAPVRERLRLFYLPDLSKMEVGVYLHETTIHRLRPGMAARVRLEALPGRKITGLLVSISHLPLIDRKSETGTEVTYFLGRVQLSESVEGLRPGMTAEVRIATGHRHDVMAVPPMAVATEHGRDVCYVVRHNRLERRPVSLGDATIDLQEIAEGLREGEQVVLQPGLARSLVARQ